MRWRIVLGILSHIGSPTLAIISRILQLDKSPSKKVQKCEQYFSYHHPSSRNINISSRGLSIFRSSNGKILIEFRITLFEHKQLLLLQQWQCTTSCERACRQGLSDTRWGWACYWNRPTQQTQCFPYVVGFGFNIEVWGVNKWRKCYLE